MGAVATSELQAADVGREVLASGGTAVDAAIAVAACLTVTEPTSNGLGGDLFALVHDPSGVAALAAHGASPRALPVDRIRAEHDRMPHLGWPAVTVPGQVSGWGALHARFGRMPWPELLAPAIRYANQGFTVGPVTARAWARALPSLGRFESWRDTFAIEGADGVFGTPSAGSTFRNPGLGASLALLADGGASAFYTELGPRLSRWSQRTGGFFTPEDFTDHRARWVEALRVRYRDLEVFGMTAPTQGVCALEALGILGGLDPTPHRSIEAIKLAFADTYATVGDGARPEALLSPDHLARRRARLGERAGPSPAPPDIVGGTVLICVVDDHGTAASVIQSNFMGFGSGLVLPGFGIALNNRGAGFTLERGHPNELAPGKRPFHTILPGLVRTPHGVGPFGCMGGQMQPQGHVQLVTALHMGSSAQQAVDARRWRWLDDGTVALEVGFDAAVAADLQARGHRLLRDHDPSQFGGAQVLWPTADGWSGGSDPRKDGGVRWT